MFELNLTAFQMACVVVFTILIVAQVAIKALSFVRPENETFRKVEIIVRSWWFIAGSFLLALSWPRWGMILFMYVLTLFALREYLKMSAVPYKGYLFYALGLLCTIQYAILAHGTLGLFLAALPVLSLWIVPGLVISRATISNIELVTSVGLGLALLIYYTSHLAALTGLRESLHLDEGEATFAVLVLILVTWCNDVFQFIAGKSFGQRKIVPLVSPNKTLAGFIGGIVGTTFLATFIMPSLLHLSFTQALVLGIILGFTGMLGDLFFSAVKRRIGIKDFSQALPGHGGLLDRLDSLVFTAPIYFHFLLWIRGAE